MSQKQTGMNPTREDFAALLEESFLTHDVAEGSVVKGRITAIEKDMAIIDVGLKVEGRVPLKEFGAQGQGRHAQGRRRGRGLCRTRRKRAGRGRCCRARRPAARKAGSSSKRSSTQGERVEGVIFNQVKGGFTVDLDGAVAFLPRSQVDIRPIRDVTPADAQSAALRDPQDGPPPRQHRRVAPHRP